MRFSKTSKGCSWRRRRGLDSNFVRDEGGRLPRDKRRIHERCMRLFRSLLNAKYDMLDPDIPKRLPQQPIACAFGTELTEKEITIAMKATGNAKVVGTDDFPVELLKIGLQ